MASGSNTDEEVERRRRFAKMLRYFADKCESEGFLAYAKHLRDEADFADEDARFIEQLIREEAPDV